MVMVLPPKGLTDDRLKQLGSDWAGVWPRPLVLWELSDDCPRKQLARKESIGFGRGKYG